ncbi:MAG: hypothetical protein LBI44_08125 [Oscillospiraceae bacterium]|nr:hypothetical protein [Oscillospiraceae bacterium]
MDGSISFRTIDGKKELDKLKKHIHRLHAKYWTIRSYCRVLYEHEVPEDAGDLVHVCFELYHKDDFDAKYAMLVYTATADFLKPKIVTASIVGGQNYSISGVYDMYFTLHAVVSNFGSDDIGDFLAALKTRSIDRENRIGSIKLYT